MSSDNETQSQRIPFYASIFYDSEKFVLIYLLSSDSSINFPFQINKSIVFQSAFQGSQRRPFAAVSRKCTCQYRQRAKTALWVTNSIYYISNYNIYLISKSKKRFQYACREHSSINIYYKCIYSFFSYLIMLIVTVFSTKGQMLMKTNI